MESAVEKYIGVVCEIKTLMNDHVGSGIIGDVETDSDSIDIIPREGEFLPTMPYNQPVKIICHSPKLGFRLFLGRIYLSSRDLMRVIDVGTQQSVERRQYFRLNTSIKGDITRAANKNDPNSEPECFIVDVKDVSLGGLRIITKETFEPADRFAITFVMLKDNMDMTCQVCRQIYSESLRTGEHQYGCRFVDVTDKQLDKLCGDLFELQRREIRKKKDK